MCGIAGMSGGNEKAVRSAARSFSYRGPDAFGIFSDGKLTLGHNRLSIIDLDERSNQPMWDMARDLGVVFNGEIYNHKELRRELEREHGIHFKTQSDTEVVLAAYRVWGTGCVRRLEGMFVFVIYDVRAELVRLFSDHQAIKPLFYSVTSGRLMFASALAGVLKLWKESGMVPEIDQESLGLYFAFGYVPAPRTLYAGIHRLPPRTIVTFDLETNEAYVETYEMPEPQLVNEAELQHYIERAVESHLIADVPVGVFFSGGTDSSLIVSILKKLGVDLQTFSVAVEGREEDAQYFTPIAKYLGIAPKSYHFGATEFDQVYHDVVSKIDEPIYDNSLFPSYFVAKQAAAHVKVILSGEGGDEYFFGYPRSLVLGALEDAAIDPRLSLIERLYLYLPYFPGKNRLFERVFVLLRRPLAYYLLTMSPGKGSLSCADWGRAKQVLSASRSPRRLDADWYLVNDLLRKLDLATMYASIEGRVPLLDVRVIQAALAYQPEFGPEAKPRLKRVLAKYLPSDLVYRRKSGFGLASRSIFKESKYLKADLVEALEFLTVRRLLPLTKVPTTEHLIDKNPALAFAILFLFHAVRNGEKA